MQRSTILQLVAAAVVALLCCNSSALHVSEVERESLPQMPFYHRFSKEGRAKAEKSGGSWPFPELNTPEYHRLLVHRDLVRHGRRLATTSTSGLLTFDMGNLTSYQYGLYYTEVSVGTPSVTYFVALDSGSDLFWLPCECKACAPADKSFSFYVPSISSTSKSVTCASSECASVFTTCPSSNNGQCTYQINYGSGNTSTSGTLYQDVLHLIPNTGAAKDITSPILVGCGQTQTGTLLDGSVPDGLMGLGRQSFSVPSRVSKSGLVGDSFSTCFSLLDMSGRIVFGDVGSSNITTTPFEPTGRNSYLAYVIGLDSITVENDSIPVNSAILFDTGTTVTLLSSAVYKAVIASFAKQTTNYERLNLTDGTFELCYATSDPNPVIPQIFFELGGNASFYVINPYVPVTFQNGSLAGFCLLVVDGVSNNIFGVGFMLGYNMVFNKQDSILGFEPSDCYSEVAFASSSPMTSPALTPKAAQVPSRSPGSSSPVTGPPPFPGEPTTTPGQGGNSGQRISVPLLPVFCMGLLVNFLLL